MTTQPDHQPMKISDDELRAEYNQHADIILETLSRWSRFIGLPVTVTIPGATITGVAIPYETYRDRENKETASLLTHYSIPADAQNPETIQEAIDSTPDCVFPPTPEEFAELEEKLPRRFLHLDQVRMIGNGYTPIAPLDLDRLRIPIAQITSWCIGRHY